MNRSKSVEAYIAKKESWRMELEYLRGMLLNSGLEETIKWGAPVYMINEKNVVGLAAFKDYTAIWFFQGGLLKDEAGKLVNAQEGKTKALRQWRFKNIQEMKQDTELIKAYLQEATANARAGKEIKPQRKKELIIPDELQQRLTEDAELAKAFQSLTPGRQREYAEYIAEAKRVETRQKRLQKIIPMILEGKGLNDKYKKC
ncbi:MAG: hypothetical protein D6677_06775 [Calditrichaeota bacterium]|nr:MAG: hypothetical protein D6677_06775 [Calditrichota bacterium]